MVPTKNVIFNFPEYLISQSSWEKQANRVCRNALQLLRDIAEQSSKAYGEKVTEVKENANEYAYKFPFNLISFKTCPMHTYIHTYI